MIRLDAVSIPVTLTEGPGGAPTAEMKALPPGAATAPDLATAEAAFAAGLSDAAEQPALPVPTHAMQVVTRIGAARASPETEAASPPEIAIALPENGAAEVSIAPEANTHALVDAVPRSPPKSATPSDISPDRTEAPIEVSAWAISAMTLPVSAAAPRAFAEPAPRDDATIPAAMTTHTPKRTAEEAVLSDSGSEVVKLASSVTVIGPGAPDLPTAPSGASAAVETPAEETVRAFGVLPDRPPSAPSEATPDRAVTDPVAAGAHIPRPGPDTPSPTVAAPAATERPARDARTAPPPLQVSQGTEGSRPTPITPSVQDDAPSAPMEVQITSRRSTPGPRLLPEQRTDAGPPATPAEPDTPIVETPDLKATLTVTQSSATRSPGSWAAAIAEPSSRLFPEPARRAHDLATTDNVQKAPFPLPAPGTLPRAEKPDDTATAQQFTQAAEPMPLADTPFPQATAGQTPSPAVTSAPDVSRIMSEDSSAAPPPTDGTGPDIDLPLAHQLGRGLAQANPSCELTLAPAELGRVKLTLEGPAHSLALRISAERPETLALLRRHIDQLTREFKDLGYPSLTVSFTREGSLAASLVNAALAGQDTGQSAGQNPGSGGQGNQPQPPVATGQPGDMQSGARWSGGGHDPGGQAGGQSHQRQPPVTRFETSDPVPSGQPPSTTAATGPGGLDLRL